MDEQVNFYSNLYRSKIKKCSQKKQLNASLTNKNIPKLKSLEKIICENPLTVDDLTEALKNMALDKSPGVDGFTTNFCRHFWQELKQPLLKSFFSIFFICFSHKQ